ncbi:MAG: glycoside hydrolase family 2 protein [Sedimentisphaeraceae bacterium JB056]
MFKSIRIICIISLILISRSFAKTIYVPVDISKQCTAANYDEVAGDKKGGWTDQGPGNDFSNLPVGKQVFNDIPFNILSAEENDGKNCIVLNIDEFVPDFVKNIKVQRSNVKNIYFLHASAYNGNVGDSGKYVMNFRYSGKEYEERIERVRMGYVSENILFYPVEAPLVSPMNMADWWGCVKDLPDAKVAWRGSIPSCPKVGILNYKWTNPNPQEYIESIDFYGPTKTNVVPILLAVTLEIEQRDFVVSKDEQKLYYNTLNGITELEDKLKGSVEKFKSDISGSSDKRLVEKLNELLPVVISYSEDGASSLEGLKSELETFRTLAETDTNVSFVSYVGKLREVSSMIDDKIANVKGRLTDIYDDIIKNNFNTAASVLSETKKILVSKNGYSARVSELFADASQTYLDDKPTNERHAYTNSKNAVYWAEKALARAKAANTNEIIFPAVKEELPPTVEISNSVRAKICLNGKWQVAKGSGDAYPSDGWFEMNVPHSGWSNGKGWRSEFDSVELFYGIKWTKDEHSAWYKTGFAVPSIDENYVLELEFKRVWHYSEVYANGIYCGNNIGGNHRFFVDVTPALEVNPSEIELVVYVEDTTLTELEDGTNIFATGAQGSVQQGGISDDVFLHIRNKTAIKDPFIQTSYMQKEVAVSCDVLNYSEPCSVKVRIEDEGEVVKDLGVLNRGAEGLFAANEKWESPALWAPSEPWGQPGKLYTAVYELYSDDALVDKLEVPFGFREFYIQGDKFYLNGKPIFLQGDHIDVVSNGGFSFRNPTYLTHYLNICRGANVNFIRTHCNEPPEWWWDIADELGMMFESHNHIMHGTWKVVPDKNWTDPVWKKNMQAYFKSVVTEFRNHPSIVMWVPTNEIFAGRVNDPSWDEAIAFWQDIDKFIKKIDPTRPLHHHGSQGISGLEKYPFEIASLHYGQDSDTKSFSELYPGVPTFFSEFQDLDLMRRTSRDAGEKYQEALDLLSAYLTNKISLCKENGIAGTSPYQIITWVALDKTFAKTLKDDQLKVNWPTSSGIGVKTDIIRHPTIYWQKEDVPVCKRTSLYYDWGAVHNEMDPLKQVWPLQVYVKGAQPGEIVYAFAADGIAEGVKADSNGNALFFLTAEGAYEFKSKENDIKVELMRKPYQEIGGFGHWITIELDK